MIKINDLKELQEILNISAIAKKCNINSNTLRGKIIRGTELSVTESEMIEKLLKKYKISFNVED